MTTHRTETFEPIVTATYRSERSHPQPGQSMYLHLSDLLMAVKRSASHDSLLVLDYGCGASPYRELLPNAVYRRADAIEIEDLDYKVAEDQSIAEKSGVFDLILSTQVLEHVKEPQLYLAEAFRLLRTGGRIVLTTHGIYEEHGRPYDFRRWTADGLRGEIEGAGFGVLELNRLTTNGRAMAFLLEQHSRMLSPSRRHPLGLLFWCFAGSLRKLRWTRQFHRWCDITFANSRVVDASVPGHSITIGLCVVGEKR